MRNVKKKDYKPFGVTISGGLARGFGAIGFFRFLEEEGLEPEVLAGSSAGALLSAAYLAGYNWKDIIDIIKKVRFRDFLSVKSIIKLESMVSKEKVKKRFHALFGDKNIEDLPRKLIIYASDPRSRKRLFITKGNLVNALLASSAYPIIFPDVRYKYKVVYDGDLTSAYSSKKLKKMGAKVVIGVRYDPSKPKRKARFGIVDNAMDFYRFLMGRMVYLKSFDDPVDMKISYNAADYNYTNFKDIEKISKRAYRETRKKRREIFSLLKKKRN